MYKKIAIIQSNYIPWKGYFDIMNSVDEFVLYDDVQFTKNDWRNRNKIKTRNGSDWLTIPVKHNFGQKISEVTVHNNLWRIKHWKTLLENYSKSKYFNLYKEQFETLYLGTDEQNLSEINYQFTIFINEIIGIKTKIHREYILNPELNKTERLVSLCKMLNANEYISGPSARNYLNEILFLNENIKVTWFNYSDYREYNQLYPPFDHAVSIIDLIFNEGPNAHMFLKSFNNASKEF
jgi:hypothetical protein